MKKIKTICTLISAFALAVNCFAVNAVSEGDISIEFPADTQLSIEEQEVIADKIVNGTSGDDAAAYNIICTLFGHDLSTEYVHATQHKVNELSPRCLRKTYEVELCSRCDYNTVELVSGVYLACCPEE